MRYIVIILSLMTTIVYSQNKTVINIGEGSGSGSGSPDSVGIVIPEGELLQGTGTKAPYSTDSLKWDAGLYVNGPVNLTSLSAGTPDSALYIDASGFVGKRELSSVQMRTVASDINFNSTPTLTDVTGLSADLEAGESYEFEGVIFSVSAETMGLPSCSGGGKASISGTVTFTELIWGGYALSGNSVVDHIVGTAFGTAFGSINSGTGIAHHISGTVTVNAAGTLKLQYAQKTSCDGLDQAGMVYAGSYLKVTKIN